MTNSRPSGRFHMGNFIKRDTCQPEEKLRDLMRRCTSWRDSACLVGTYTGNRLAQRLERVCVCVCVYVRVCGKATPSGVCHHGNCLHGNNTTCHSGLPDNGGQMGSKGWRMEPVVRPQQRHQIKFCRYSEAKSLWFYCLSEVVSVILYMAIWPFLLFSFCL